MPKDPADLKFLLPIFFPFLMYPLGAWFILRFLGGTAKRLTFCVYNVVASFILLVFVLLSPLGFDVVMIKRALVGLAPLFSVYVLLVVGNYLLLRASHGGKNRAMVAAAYAAPLLELCLIKYLPLWDKSFAELLRLLSVPHLSVVFLGISYVSFRLCYLVQEVQNELVEMPTLWDYLSFAFFVPTMSVGPINPYAKFISYLDPPDRTAMPVGRAWLRIVVGLWKYLFVANMLGQLTYGGLMLDGHPHGVLDLVISIFAYSIYLYCNFSGLCDVVIGVSGLLGIRVIENFDQPFIARNFQEFWSRWHISLSSWLRDMMFTPLVKFLARRWGAKQSNHAIAVAIMATFITIGIWHGAGLNFLLFGISQGVGVVTVHYATIAMRKRLGKERFAAYRANRFYYYLGCATTFVYFSLTLMLFANNMNDLGLIFRSLNQP